MHCALSIGMGTDDEWEIVVWNMRCILSNIALQYTTENREATIDMHHVYHHQHSCPILAYVTAQHYGREYATYVLA